MTDREIALSERGLSHGRHMGRQGVERSLQGGPVSRANGGLTAEQEDVPIMFRYARREEVEVC